MVVILEVVVCGVKIQQILGRSRSILASPYDPSYSLNSLQIKANSKAECPKPLQVSVKQQYDYKIENPGTGQGLQLVETWAP